MKPSETIDYHIKVTWHAIANLYNMIACEYGLTQATGFVLLHIDNVQGSPATSIAPLMGMKATSLSRMLKNMETDGLIFRKSSKNDKRLVMIHLTEDGLKKQKIAKGVVKEFNQHIEKNIDQAQLNHFYKMMESISALTEEYRNMKTIS